jgi:hypothetical protein
MFFPKHQGFALAFACLLLFLPGALLAQQSGSINGAVTDESGGAIPNAQVVLTNAAQGTTYNATSNNSGDGIQAV